MVILKHTKNGFNFINMYLYKCNANAYTNKDFSIRINLAS